jgi:ssDNA-binding Zn-finger/Zn-ribbon topoisomerase 1
MPYDIKLYPPNWQKIAKKCKEQAGWKCEQCGAQHGEVRTGKTHKRPFIVNLAAAHLNHDIQNKQPALAALCQSCHMEHDGSAHAKTRKRKARQAQIDAGQGTLPGFEEKKRTSRRKSK